MKNLTNEDRMLSDSDHTTSSRANADADEGCEVKRTIQRENKDVELWRELVTGILVIAGCFVTIATYIVLSHDQTTDFRDSFKEFCDSAGALSRMSSINFDATYSSMSQFITSESLTSNQNWPSVTISSFEIYGNNALEVTKANFISYSPLVADENDKKEWEAYSQKNYRKWVKDSYILSSSTSSSSSSGGSINITKASELYEQSLNQKFSNQIYTFQPKLSVDIGPGPYAPIWQMFPPPVSSPETVSLVNYDLLTNPELNQLYHSMMISKKPVFSPIVLDPRHFYDNPTQQQQQKQKQKQQQTELGDASFLHYTSTTQQPQPRIVMFQPIFKDLNKHADEIVAILQVVVSIEDYLTSLFSTSGKNVTFVVTNTCGEEYTFWGGDEGAQLIGKGDQHDILFNRFQTILPLFGSHDYAEIKKHRSTQYDNNTIDSAANTTTAATTKGYCTYDLYVYPSIQYRISHGSQLPMKFTFYVGVIFIAVSVVFLIYDRYLQKRKEKMDKFALKSNAIVASLFPKNIRNRLFADAIGGQEGSGRTAKSGSSVGSRNFAAPSHQIKGYLKGDDQRGGIGSKPLADLFPETTVLFADLVGFTAWSSVREPSQVFTLLESLFGAFDEIAGLRRVFKVETVGDCYVAVVGLPDPRRDHAVVMSKFATECMVRMKLLVQELELTLGPDTADLSMRFGLHSGPVTAGVLRGEKSRFQLFGDTVNTAARMESTSERGKIQLSQATADLLIAAGKGFWLQPRKDKVVAKGKGEMITHWLMMKATARSTSEGSLRESVSVSSSMSSNASSSDNDSDDGDLGLGKGIRNDLALRFAQKLVQKPKKFDKKTERLISWNSDLLLKLLKQVVARRQALNSKKDASDPAEKVQFGKSNETVLDEVKEIITLPKFDAKAAKNQEDSEEVDLKSAVMLQLHDFVATIASMYRDNAFHNFEHASHVSMSVAKLLTRISSPDGIDYGNSSTRNILAKIHDHTYGITSDPLTQFSVVFSALIHDVDHYGVPNFTLVKEGSEIAAFYKNRSVAEQNSVDRSWDVLMSDSFKELRAAIYCNEDELRRFRQIVVNTVMATDLADKELKDLRNDRWDKAFKESCHLTEPADVATNRKATIVIEHLIQASDVAHTMQHWHIYRKWNERFFKETYKAYKDGKSDADPSAVWYKGEIGFFDFYVIPLAKKLKECGVFGVSSDEYLNYAVQNREEWKQNGEKVVAEMLAAVHSEEEKAKESPVETRGERRSKRHSLGI